ncbi:ROK family transcriptional regulator [Actinomadura barringtoniae]|uniref:ROK family transcriptional regulator n=1 Tax=Actinomadura barringtoniae TaxID=1427535 RepID=A0A939PNP3_9ACTN|nr:ROK family transcriptional regulator [Actinomadura barringtoniae]MBO2455585.1 ROK family transcriptional regulator [Actinomadura barringtoniae]
MESSDARRANRAVVLGELLARGTTTRVAVAQATGLSKATVTRVVEELVGAGLVRESGPLTEAGGGPGSTPGSGPGRSGGERSGDGRSASGRSGRGRQALAICLAGEHRLVCGVDLGGTSTRFLVTDLAGRVRAWAREATPGDLTTQQMADWLVTHVRRLTDGRELGATAVGLPGAVHPETGAVRTAPNLPQLQGDAFAQAVKAALPGVTTFANDVNAALLGEVTAGAAQGHANAVMIAAGTGLGAAVYLGGRPLPGRTGGVGEFGVLPFGAGNLEDAISGGGMVRYARELGHAVADAAQIFELNAPRPVLDQARNGLRTMLTAVTVAYEPDVIVLAGGVAPAFAPWLPALAADLAEFTPQPPVLRTSVLGDPGGAIGSWVTALHAVYQGLDVALPDLGGAATTVLDHLTKEGHHVPAATA